MDNLVIFFILFQRCVIISVFRWTPAGRGVPGRWGHEEDWELSGAAEKRSIVFGAGPGLSPRGHASLAVGVSPAGRDSQTAGREAAIQNTDWCRSASLSPRSDGFSLTKYPYINLGFAAKEILNNKAF